MSEFIPWKSQPLALWASKYAQGKFIELDGRKTHYIEKGEGKPVVLLHGFFYDSDLWAANIDALAENFKVYALDLWGFGYSTREPLDYGYQLYADRFFSFESRKKVVASRQTTLLGFVVKFDTCLVIQANCRNRATKILFNSRTPSCFE